MENPVSRLAYLFYRFLENSLQPGERQEFLDLVGREENIEELNLLIDESIREGRVDRKIDRERAGLLFDQIMYKASDKRATPVVSIRRVNYFKWVAAVALMATLSGAYFFFVKDNAAPGVAEQKLIPGTQAIVSPGSEKATLTLGNGLVIQLDTARNGTLALQSNAEIVKLDDGTVLYRPGNLPVDKEISFNTIKTPSGGQYQIVLPDGTRVWLNAASALRFPSHFSEKNREVALSGEAYFEVARDPGAPFVVSVGQSAVTVLGTHFNINGYGDEEDLCTTLLEGSVRFSNGATERTLEPGQQARLNRNSSAVSVHKADIDQVMGWKNGFFEFDNIDLAAIMRQISRWYDVDVVYQSIDKNKKLGGGISRKSALPDLLRLLENSGVKARLEGRTLIVGN